MKQNIVIIGANGFVGSHLVNKIAAISNTNVVCFDRYTRPQSFNNSSNIKIIKGDFFNSKDVDKALVNVDYLIHCFSATTPHLSDNDPYKDIQMLKRSVEIFEKSCKKGVKKIIFVSSGGAVYGNIGDEYDANESDNPKPISPYGICKLAIEHYLEYFKRKYNTPYIIYRLTNPYGPGQKYKNNQGVVPAFLDKIKNNEEITVLGDGTSSRDFIFIDDAVKMIIETFMQPNKYSVYNIGSGIQTSINEIITTLKQILKIDIKINYREAPASFPLKTSVSIDRFITEFGKPKLTNFRDGISKTLKSNDPN